MPEKDTLIAIMNDPKALAIAKREHWYRIPVSTKRSIDIVREGKVKYLAFYQTKIFKDEAYMVKWFAEVMNVSTVTRDILFPEEINSPKTGKEYYKIEIGPMEELSPPVESNRPRRITFIQTTFRHLREARELNDLFAGSPLEEKLWEKFRDEKIPAEREFLVTTKQGNFYLDFALFCKTKKIDVEIDGDKHHTEKEDIQKDKDRANILESLGWNILRYTTQSIRNDLEDSLEQIKDTINRSGGIEKVREKVYKYITMIDDDQEKMF